MEFLAEHVAVLQEATDVELQTYLEAHPQPYTISPQLSFAQLYFSQELREDRVDGDARQVLARLQGNRVGTKQAEQLGDRSHMIPECPVGQVSGPESGAVGIVTFGDRQSIVQSHIKHHRYCDLAKVLLGS